MVIGPASVNLGVCFRSPHETVPDPSPSQAQTANAIAYVLSLR